MQDVKTLQQAIIHFSNFEKCKEFMVKLRWPDGVVKCPRCDGEKVKWLEKARVWKCYAKHPSPTFSLKTGTIFEDSPLGLEKWLPCVWLIVNAKNGVSSWEIHRALGVTQKSAWFMLHRARVAFKEVDFRPLSGIIEADETYVGGAAKNMHKSQRKLRGIHAGRPKESTPLGKMIVMGLLERKGRIRAGVIDNTKRKIVKRGPRKKAK